MKPKILAFLEKIFGIDHRSATFFRVFLGLILVLETITKASNLFDFYVDEGAIPRALAISEQGLWEFSFHLFQGQWPFIVFLFLLQGAFALCVLFNYKTKLFLFLSWIMILSLQTRASIILNAGDCLLRVLLFWSLFLPFSRKETPRSIFNLGSFCILLQMLVMYFSTALLRNHPIWNKEFTAIQYALSLEQFTTPFGHYLLKFPALLKILTIKTYYLELLGPILLVVCPLWWLRSLVVFSFMGLHFGLILTMELGLFPYVCILGWTLFLPTKFWNFLETRIRSFSLLKTKLNQIFSRDNPQWQLPQKNWIEYSCQALLAYSLVIMLVWNISYLTKKGFAVPQPLRASGLFLRLDQKWNMFAPFPMKVDGWFVAPGKLRDGTEVDVYTWKPVTWERPSSFWDHYINTQWRKYLSNIWDDGNNEEQLQFGKYLCRRWNNPKNHSYEKQVLSYEIYFMKLAITLDGSEPKPEKQLFWQHSCFSN